MTAEECGAAGVVSDRQRGHVTSHPMPLGNSGLQSQCVATVMLGKRLIRMEEVLTVGLTGLGHESLIHIPRFIV